MARTRLYRDGELVQEDFPVGDISDHIEEPNAFVWLDYCAPTDEELATIARELSLHPLAVEDAAHEHQRPKLDRYDSHLFISAYALRLDAQSGELATTEIGVFVTRHALVTVRKDEGVDIESVVARWDESAELASHGVSFLLWGLLDYIVDGHFEAVQSLDARSRRSRTCCSTTRRAKARCSGARSSCARASCCCGALVLPMREVVNSLMRRDLHVLDQAMVPYYQDVYDHVLRATDWTESLRDLVTTILETNITIQGNRMNLIMKKVTSWAAIIAVPTAITGFYGQNVPYPGFSAALGLLVLLGAHRGDLRRPVLGVSPSRLDLSGRAARGPRRPAGGRSGSAKRPSARRGHARAEADAGPASARAHAQPVEQPLERRRDRVGRLGSRTTSSAASSSAPISRCASGCTARAAVDLAGLDRRRDDRFDQPQPVALGDLAPALPAEHGRSVDRARSAAPPASGRPRGTRAYPRASPRTGS